MKPFNNSVVKLSEAIESSIHADTKKIILNFKDIEVIDSVSVIYHNCETLYLSQNKIKCLHGLYQFKSLKNLSLSYNLVEDFKQLQSIKASGLQSLSLQGNPISLHPNYRAIVIEMFPKLKSLDSKIISSTERENVSVISQLKILYLNMYYTIDQLCGRLYRENSSYLIKLELYRRAYGSHNVFNREYPPVEVSVMKQYSSWTKCIKYIPSIESTDKTRWTTSKLIVTIEHMFYKDAIEKAMSQAIKQLGESYETTMQNLGRTLMEKIKNFYEKKHGFRAQYLSPERNFIVFSSDSIFLEVMLQILIEVCSELERLEQQRILLMNTNLYALSIPGVRMSRDTAPNRENPKAVWDQLEKSVSRSFEKKNNDVQSCAPLVEKSIQSLKQQASSNGSPNRYLKNAQSKEITSNTPPTIHVRKTVELEKARNEIVRLKRELELQKREKTLDLTKQEKSVEPKIKKTVSEPDTHSGVYRTPERRRVKTKGEQISNSSNTMEEMAIGFERRHLKRRAFTGLRRYMKEHSKQREERAEKRATTHYTESLMHKVLIGWHQIANLRARCRTAIRILRRVQRLYRLQRAFFALKLWRDFKKDRHGRQAKEGEIRTHKRRTGIEQRPKSAPVRGGSQHEEKSEAVKDMKLQRDKSERKQNRRRNMLMISATTLGDGDISPELIEALKRNIKKQKAWLKQLT